MSIHHPELTARGLPVLPAPRARHRPDAEIRGHAGPATPPEGGALRLIACVLRSNVAQYGGAVCARLAVSSMARPSVTRCPATGVFFAQSPAEPTASASDPLTCRAVFSSLCGRL